ncbi:MAG: hypothetical protein AAGA92_04860 [Planctomycetota bacterium]
MSSLTTPAVAVESAWVTTGATGRLVYTPDAEGDRVLDFSDVGYMGVGIEAIPSTVANAVTISPVSGDDTVSIQTAINQVSALPIGPDGYRGAVLLQPGTYDINTQLRIEASGVVLRGSGQDLGGSILKGRNAGPNGTNQRQLIEVLGSGSRSNIGSTRNLIDKVVPVGSRSFRVDVPGEFSVGDTVRIERPSTQAWINALGMDNPPNGDPPWQPGTMNVRYDRVVTRVEGDRVFVDAPLATAFEQQYGGGTIRRYNWNGAIENVGIENLRGDSDFDSPTDEDHAWEFISIGAGQNSDRAQNVWVRDVTALHFGDSAVVANPSAKWVTVDNATSLEPVSQITGSRRYTYDLSGELGFVTNSSADEGRHDFVNNSTRPPGPNVFHNSIATNANSDTGPHQRWASGTLFDNITVEGNAINARNRGSFGTTHGWSGANMVIWNSTADSYRVQNPPTAQNWLVGSTGTIVEDTTFGPQPSGNYDAHSTPVTTGGTNSLYEAQRNDARDLRVFRWVGTNDDWTDASGWDQAATPGVYAVSMRDYLIGDVDDYTFDGPGSDDDLFVDPAWEAYILGSSSHPIVGHDTVTTNQNVAFTIQTQVDPGEQVVHATLALAMKQSGGDVASDFVRVIDNSLSNRFDFDDLGWDAQINPTNTFVGVLDLGGSLPGLQSGSVNVQVNDDTAVEWALYTATVATPKADPDGADVFLDAGGVTGLNAALPAIQSLTIGGAGAGELDMGFAGSLEINGDFSQAANGTLGVELLTTIPTGFSSIQVDGQVTLAGVLEVSLGDLGGSPLSPAAGDAFELITSDSLTGQFDTLALPSLADGLTWGIDYANDDVTLGVFYQGDFDEDGDVDANDLALWQAGFGLAGAGVGHSDGDADGDGDVDLADIAVWQQQFGNAAVVAASYAVPEPATALALAAFSLTITGRVTRRRPLTPHSANTRTGPGCTH